MDSVSKSSEKLADTTPSDAYGSSGVMSTGHRRQYTPTHGPTAPAPTRKSTSRQPFSKPEADSHARKRSSCGALLPTTATDPLSTTHEPPKPLPAGHLELNLLRRQPPLCAAALQVDRGRREERDEVAAAGALDQQQVRPEGELLGGAAARLVKLRPLGRRARVPLRPA